MAAKSSIGTSAVQLISTSTPVSYGVQIKAAAANASKVHVGFANTVTANADDTTDGYELAAGQEVFIPVAHSGLNRDASNVWLIATGASQKVFYIPL